MSKSSTKYLDMLLLDDRGQVTKEAMDTVKTYCGLFGFVLGVCNNSSLDNTEKSKLITNILDSAIMFMTRRYEVNLDLYNKQVTDNLQSGKLFESLSVLPAKMREDFEIGLNEAHNFLLAEVRDILKILDEDLDV